jgi:DNA-binding XRE family transcriptional regulator
MVRYAGVQTQSSFRQALNATTAEECAEALRYLARQFGSFREAMPLALRGQLPAVEVVVDRWHWLVDEVLSIACEALPDLVRRVEDGFVMVTASRTLSQDPVTYLYCHIGEAPFSPFVSRFGQDVGVGVVAVDAVRSLLPGCSPLPVEESLGWPDLPEGTNAIRYRRLVEIVLRALDQPLTRVRNLFGLTNSDVAALFGVTRQAVDQWENTGEVPGVRREKLANLLAVGELLERKLAPGRLPLVARRRADAYGGKTMLDMVAANRDAELRELTDRALDWSHTA